MAFSASQLNIAVNFDLVNFPNNFSLEDTTDYSGETYSNVLGLLLAVKPGGATIRNNTNYSSPDIDLAVSPFSNGLGSLPLNSDSTVVKGVYSFTYTVKIEDLLQSYTIVSNDSAAKTFTVNGNITSLILDPTATAYNCVDTVTTALTIVSATYSASTGLTTVTVGETLGTLTSLAEFQFTVDQIFSKTFTQDYSYVTPSVCLNWVTDECCSSMAITDVTVYESGATVNRTHVISYPVGIVPTKDDIVSPLQEVNITPIWTGTWVDVFEASISVTVGLISISDLAKGVKEHKVSSDDGLCQIYACLSNMATKYTSYLTSAPQRALEMQKYISQASAAFMAYTVGKKCAEANYEQYLTLITDIADECGCGCDCADCADGVPTQVVGCCENVGGSDYTILMESLDGSMSISSNTVGTTTTFDIEINDTWLLNQIQNEIEVTSIDALADVNTNNIAAATGQVLVWNQGLNRWQRGTSQTNLVNLNDVDDTGLANNMVLYYDGGTSTFKFKLIELSVSDLSDVILTTLTSGQILKYNGTDWVNVDNYLSLLGDVNTTGIANGKSIKWDTATSKWVIYTPVQTLDDLSDVDTTGVTIGDSILWDGAEWVPYTPVNSLALDDLTDVVITGVANKDRFNYITGTGWQNTPLPTFTGGYLAQLNFAYTKAGYYDFSASYDTITSKLEFRGVITYAVVGGLLPSVSIARITAAIPLSNMIFPIAIVDGGTGNYLHAIAEIYSGTGDIFIVSHVNAAGVTQSGAPVGAYHFDSISLVI